MFNSWSHVKKKVSFLDSCKKGLILRLIWKKKVQFFQSSFKKKVQIFESYFWKRRFTSLSQRERHYQSGTPTSVCHQSTTRHWATTTQQLDKTKKVSAHKWINEWMTNFVHRKAHVACSKLHSAPPARLIVSLSLSYLKDSSILWVMFKKGPIHCVMFEKSSILWVILFKKKVQFFESYSGKRVQFFAS